MLRTFLYYPVTSNTDKKCWTFSINIAISSSLGNLFPTPFKPQYPTPDYLSFVDIAIYPNAFSMFFFYCKFIACLLLNNECCYRLCFNSAATVDLDILHWHIVITRIKILTDYCGVHIIIYYTVAAEKLGSST